jgi:phenylalanyl-tRNA synthetase beta chain
VAEGVVDVYPSPAPRAPIHVRLRRVEDILGIRTNRSEVVNVLKALGAGVSSGPHGSLSVVPASFRSDLSREIDVIEEVARVTGYHRIPATLPEVRVQGGEIPEHMRCVREIKRLLAAQGLYETISMSFTSPAMNETFPGIGTAGEAVEIVNPLGRDESQLRRSLLGELAAIVRFNRSRETKNVAAFSVGKVFWRTGTTQEGWRVAGALAGEVPKLGLRASRPSDFTDIKGIVESLLDHVHFRVDGRWECSRDAAFHPGRSAWLRVDDRVVAVTGSLHPEVEERLELHENSWFFELDLDTVLSYRQPRSIFRELPRFPAVVRDVAIIVDEDFAADRVVRFVRESKRELVEDVTLFDEYFGEPMPAGKKSLAYSISYRAPDRTLTDEEVNEVHGALISALSRELNIELRS